MAQPDRVLRILSINESEIDNQEIVRHLEFLGYPIQYARVSTPEEFKIRLDLAHWTIVLFMTNTHSFSARDALALTKKHDPELPFILISDGIGEEEVANMMKAGAEDVVLMSRSHRLLQVVRRVLRESEIRGKEAKASSMAHQAYAAREQMLAIVSHDIKNPLSAIQLEAQMLLKIADRNMKSLLSEEVKIQANRILKTTDRLKALIADLLDRNKSADGLSSLTKSKCNVSKIFQEVLDSNRPLIKEKDIQIRASFPQDLTSLLDKNKIFQVLNNLLSNAIKFTPYSGNIQLSIEDTDSELAFHVSDNGPGLKVEDLNRVFEKYWTGEVSGCSGTGLGLFICKTIVEAHGGHIRVENLPQGGSHFWFTIPKPSLVALPEKWIKDHKRKILIIDDDHDLREVISCALGKEGFSVHSYSNPMEALDSLRRGRHSPQLIIVDFHMDGMKGSQFLKFKDEIEAKDVKECPVLMISASPDEVYAEASPELYQEILTKPIDLEALVGNIKKYIN
jgi:signal transduction histidine kinase/CheY-like chemotaxis protein